MKLSYLWKGLPGHPIHPPLTDATIGVYTFATVAALSDVLSITNHVGAQAWWIALISASVMPWKRPYEGPETEIPGQPGSMDGGRGGS